MAIVNNNPLLSGVRGRIGGFVVRQINGNTVVSRRPEKKRRVLTIVEAERRKRFANATRYAKMHMVNPELKSMYATGVNQKKRSPYLVATTDFLTPPEIHHVLLPKNPGRVGDKIQIKATDDFKVVSVKVSITDSKDTLLESGNAKPVSYPEDHWCYGTKAASSLKASNIVRIEARDFAGNLTTATWALIDAKEQKKIFNS